MDARVWLSGTPSRLPQLNGIEDLSWIDSSDRRIEVPGIRTRGRRCLHSSKLCSHKFMRDQGWGKVSNENLWREGERT